MKSIFSSKSISRKLAEMKSGFDQWGCLFGTISIGQEDEEFYQRGLNQYKKFT